MSGRCTRRSGVPADRVERQRAGIKRLDQAFGVIPGSSRSMTPSDAADRKAGLLAMLGFGPRQRKGDEA